MKTTPRINSTSWWIIGSTGVLAASVSHAAILFAFIAFGALVVLYCDYRITGTANGLRIFGLTAAAVVGVRLLFRFVFSSEVPGDVIFNLPKLSLHLAGSTISLLGPVTWLALWSGISDGLRMASIVLSIGVAATMANTRSLLHRAPAALQEFATATAIALNLAPQLVASLTRIRRAQKLRGNLRGARGLSANLTPLLEDSMAQSMNLAASMETRGFGRTGALAPRTLWFSRLSSFLGIALLGIAIYLLLATQDGSAWPLSLALLGLLLLGVSLQISALHHVRTSYETEPITKWDLTVRIVTVTLLVLLLLSHLGIVRGWGWLA